jgi:hypothetical protein
MESGGITKPGVALRQEAAIVDKAYMSFGSCKPPLHFIASHSHPLSSINQPTNQPTNIVPTTNQLQPNESVQ